MVSKRSQRKSLFLSRPLENADQLIEWAKKQGFPTTLGAGEIHATIAYSKKPIKWPEARDDRLTVVSKSDRAVMPLGDGGAVVLRFSNDSLRARWQELLDQGASYDFPDYKPHVTISWKADGVDVSKLSPFEGDLVFGPEILREIDEDWKSKVTEKFFKADVVKVDAPLGLVFGWGIICKQDGEDYWDVQDDQIPEDSMLRAATKFMQGARAAKEMHSGEQVGQILFAYPLTTDVAKAMGITSKQTGLMLAMKPASQAILEKYQKGEYTGFSIGGRRIKDEEVELADAA